MGLREYLKKDGWSEKQIIKILGRVAEWIEEWGDRNDFFYITREIDEMKNED